MQLKFEMCVCVRVCVCVRCVDDGCWLSMNVIG